MDFSTVQYRRIMHMYFCPFVVALKASCGEPKGETNVSVLSRCSGRLYYLWEYEYCLPITTDGA